MSTSSVMEHPATALQPIRQYGEFTLDPANRDIKENSITRLAEGIESLYLLDLYPIVATTEKVIMDGQHRFTVARELLVPFYAITGDEISIEDIAEANSNTYDYDDADSLALYAAMGVPSYVYLRDFLNRNPAITRISTVAKWLDNEYEGHAFAEGRFAVHRPEYAQVVADRVADLVAIQEWIVKSGRPYQQAMAALTLNPIYDHKRLMARLETIPTRLKRCTRIEDAYEMLTEVYNYRASHDNRFQLGAIPLSQMVNHFDKGGVLPIEGLTIPERGIAFQRQVPVYSTSNLDKFTLHPSARPVLTPRLEALIDFMRRRNLLHYYPIIVDANYQVLDGHKRLLAARALKLPISYVVSKNFSLHMAALAAGRSKRWDARDYLKHYCELKKPEYLYLQQFVRRHPFMVLTTLIQLLSGNDLLHGGHWNLLFKKGLFRAVRREQIERLAGIVAKVDNQQLKRLRTFQFALRQLLDNPQFDPELFIERLNKNPEEMGLFWDTKSCIAKISHVYNIGVHHENRVKFEYMNLGEQRRARSAALAQLS